MADTQGNIVIDPVDCKSNNNNNDNNNNENQYQCSNSIKEHLNQRFLVLFSADDRNQSQIDHPNLAGSVEEWTLKTLRLAFEEHYPTNTNQYDLFFAHYPPQKQS